VRSGLLEHPFQPFDLGREHSTSQRRQSVIPPSRICCPRSVRRFLNQTFFRQSLQVVVERARTESVSPRGLTNYFLHDSVAVKFVGGKREQDME
jgi:hypothetical protein